MYNYSGTPCRTPCKSYVTTTFKWCYIQVHIFDIEALFKACYIIICMPHIYFERKCYVLASQMEPVHSICEGYVMGFSVSKNKNSFNIVST